MGIGGVLGLRKEGEVGWSSGSSNWMDEESFPAVSGGMKKGGWMSALTEARAWAGGKGDGRRVESEGPPPEGNRVFDKRMAGPANMWFNRREVFAFPGAECRKREGFCPHPDRRRRGVNDVFKLGFRHRREAGIVLPPANQRRGAGFDLAEEGGGRLGLSKVDGEVVEVEEGLLEGIDVVLVIDVRVELGSPLQRGGGRPGGGKVDQGKRNAVDV